MDRMAPAQEELIEGADDLEARLSPDAAQADILVNDEASEQTEVPAEAAQLRETAKSADAAALSLSTDEPDLAMLQLSDDAADQPSGDDALTENRSAALAAAEPASDANGSAPPEDAVKHPAAEYTPATDQKSEDAHEHDLAEATDAVEAEVAAVTDQLLNEAIYEEAQAVEAQSTLPQEQAIGAAREARIEGLVSTAEATQPHQYAAEAADDKVWAVTENAHFGETKFSSLEPAVEDDASATKAARPDESDYQVLDGERKSSAEEQQALANQILSGADAAISDMASHLGAALGSPLLYSDPNDSTVAHRGSFTLDSLISSGYMPKDSAGAVPDSDPVGSTDQGFSSTNSQSVSNHATYALHSPTGDLAWPLNETQLTPHDSSLSTGASLPRAAQLEDPAEEESEAAQPPDDDLVPVKTAEEVELARSEHEAPSSPGQLTVDNNSLLVDDDAELSPNISATETQDTAAGEAETPEARISINLQPRLEWRVNAEITLEQPEATPASDHDSHVATEGPSKADDLILKKDTDGGSAEHDVRDLMPAQPESPAGGAEAGG